VTRPQNKHLKPFKRGADARRSKGRPLGSTNKWKKADLNKMREHLQEALDRNPGGIDAYLDTLMAFPKLGWREFNAFVRDVTPKTPQPVDAKITISWEDDEETQK
jgi:hypothetical protein